MSEFDDAKERIRARVDLAQLVGETVALKPAGRGQLKGLCPFHSERTPSFHVHVERGFFYCFGCGAKGDVFDYVMRTQGLEFRDALQLLGERVGIEVRGAPAGQGRRRDLLEINEAALAWFIAQLPGSPAADYLRRRGLTDETVREWGLGFAPDAWDGLLKHMLTRGVRDDDLLSAGLITENERGRRYDRFRGRVTFPIRDGMGRVVGFAGRLLDDGVPKYLNSPETALFKKGELLYGLDRARTAIRESGEVVVVEGYMDVLALHQTGFGNAVAALGANLTVEQADQLTRLDAQRVLLAFDADDAGQRAVLAGLEQSVGRRFLVQAVRLPSGKDPADAVLAGEAEREAFAAALRTGVSEVAFRFERVLAQHDASTPRGQRAVLLELLPALQPRDVVDPVASELRRLVVDHLGLDAGRLDAWLVSQRPQRLDETSVRGLRRRGEDLSPVRLLELEVVGLLLLEPEKLRERVRRALAALPAETGESELVAFAELCERCGWRDAEIVAAVQARDGGERVLERLVVHAAEASADVRLDVDLRLDQLLSRVREHHVETGRRLRQARLMQRLEEARAEVHDAATPRERLEAAYADLAEVQGALAAREGERRLRSAQTLRRIAHRRRGRA
ncbi:MAG: DNA primase [Trueperaceae bacterium]|nr:DNA primase [Trueperaceae bacterium]